MQLSAEFYFHSWLLTSVCPTPVQSRVNMAAGELNSVEHVTNSYIDWVCQSVPRMANRGRV